MSTAPAIEGFQLSPQQRALWRRQRDGEWLVAWIVLRIDGSVAPERLRGEVEQLLRRHEILRTRFCELPSLAFPLQTIGDGALDWAHGPAPTAWGSEQDAAGSGAAAAWHARALAEAQRLMERLKAIGPHVRARYWRDGETAGHLWLGGPALYWDEHSLLLLATELGRGPAGGEPVQYIDYAQWHCDLLADGAAPGRAEGIAFWRDAGLAQIALASFERGANAGTRSAALGHGRVTERARLGAQVQGLAEALGVAPGAVLAAAWGIVLSRLHGDTEMRLGYRFAGRRRDDLDGCIGPFDAWLPVRLAPDLSRSFEDEVRATGGTIARATSALDWAWGAEGIPELRPSAGLSCVVVTTGRPDGSVVLVSTAPNRSALDLQCVIHGEALELALDFDRRCVLEPQARTLCQAFATLLEHALRAPRAQAGTIDLVEPAAAAPIVARSAAAAPPRPAACLHERFEARARQSPGALAVAYGEDRLTFRELDERSNRLARALRDRGVSREEPVVLCAARSVGLIEAVLGILKAGGCFLPIDVDDPDKRVQKIATSARARFILTEPDKGAWLARAGFTVLTRGQAGWVGGDVSAEALPNVNQPGDLAYVMYTSGSTGEPKGVQIEHRSVVNLLAGLRRAIYDEHFGSGGIAARASMNAPLSFDASIKQLVLLLEGCSLHIIPAALRGDGPALLGFLQQARIDILDCTPSQLKLLLAAGLLDSPTPCPRLALLGGEPIDADTWAALAGQHRRAFYNVYGPTECTVDTTVARIAAGTAPHIGRPIENAYVRLLDPALSPVPPGFAGELCIGGLGLARGYVGQGDLTASAFIAWTPRGPGAAPERLYRSGDRARLREDGELEFLGRRDDQVKIRGVRIELEEIAAAARAHPEVESAVVVARPGDHVLLCYVIPRERGQARASTSAVTSAKLRQHLQEQLPQAMVPTHIIFVDAFPLTDNGKLDRARLPSTEGRRPELVSYQPPEGELERSIVAIWQAVLRLDRVGMLDNFFDLGGHSLLLPEVQLEIQRRLGRAMTLPQLLEFPTAQAIARHLAAEPAGPPAGPGDDDADRGAKQREARSRLAQRRQRS